LEDAVLQEDAPPPPSCDFCRDNGSFYLEDPIIDFSSGNDAVSCSGLVALVDSGLSVDFCEAERESIEAACCRDASYMDSADTDTDIDTNIDTNTNTNALPISFYGLNYNTRKGPDWAADRERCKSRSEVVRDLQLLSKITTRIRILSMVDCNQGATVWSVLNDELQNSSMEVWMGLWVGPDPQDFIDDYQALSDMMETITTFDNWRSKLSGITVGSEAIYREDVTVGEAISNLETTKALLDAYDLGDVPVAIVDIAPIYSNNQDLRLASDIIMTNTFPFWEGLPVDAAVDELEIDLGWLLDLPESKGKPFVLSEHGWPSAGYLDGVGVASPSNQLRYLQDSYCYLQQKGWAYYWFTAIDNDWRQKQDPNNTIEGNWGFLDANLFLKEHFRGFEFSCPHDGSTHSFANIDWTIPPLVLGVNDTIDDPSNASCGLWQGCEALDGDCCPTPSGEYLGCCRSENFLVLPPSNNNNNNNSDDEDFFVDKEIKQGDTITSNPSCTFCEVGQTYLSDPIISFSSGNDAVSCGGLLDLIRSGLSVDFCEAERVSIEAACCGSSSNNGGGGTTPVIPAPPSPIRVDTPPPTLRPTTAAPTNRPTNLPTKGPTKSPTNFPTRGPRNRRTPSPTNAPSDAPTLAPTVSPVEEAKEEEEEEEENSSVFPKEEDDWQDLGTLPPPPPPTSSSDSTAALPDSGAGFCRRGGLWAVVVSVSIGALLLCGSTASGGCF
jgi:exo-beta-1,3-glucanase (GH17 family)